MTFQTQRVNTIAPTVTTRLMIRPIGLRHSFGFAGVAVGVGSEFGSAAGGGAIVGVAKVCIRISGFETDKPYGHRPQDRQAEINKARKTQRTVELKANKHLTSNDDDNETREDT